MGRCLVTERTIREMLEKGSKTLSIPKDAIVTPLASELAGAVGVALVKSEGSERATSGHAAKQQSSSSLDEPMKAGQVVAFGSDHGGFQLKESLKKYAQSLGYEILDLGTTSEDPCDYPDFAYAVAIAVARKKAWRGVVVDGAGIGSCVVANKVPGIRAACCHNEFVARNAREHNDTNVLTLGSRSIGSEVSKDIMKIWLETLFAGGRHKSRVDKIVEIERGLMK